MFHQKTGLLLQSTITALLFCLFFIHYCRGQYQPIVGTLRDDIILPCYLEPTYDATTVTVEWTRPDLNPRFIYVSRSGHDLEDMKNPSYKGRTSLFIDELKHGNISLKISKVKRTDAGRYRCFTPAIQKETFIDLVVVSGATSQPVTTLAGVDGKGGVVLKCESAGWYPEPEVLWLDADGNLLSAGPTETVRGPNDLYTVSSRLTVEKKHGNNFTCRVQQKNITQSRETRIHVPDDFFKFQSSNIPIIVDVAVFLFVSVILLILAVVLFVRTQRQKTKKKILANEKQEEVELLKGNHSETNNQLQGERQKNEKTENELKTLKNELKTLTNELEKVQGEKEKLMETKKHLVDEKLKWMETEGKLKTVIQNMNKELMDTEGKLKTGIQNKIKELEKVIQTNSASGRLMIGPITVEEVHKQAYYIRLKNNSTEEIKLEGWKLVQQINDREPATYTFKESVKLQAGEILCICRHYGSSTPSGDVKLVWMDMKYWKPADELQINLINNDGEIYRYNAVM